jgi:MSHA biogenesis protein MshM
MSAYRHRFDLAHDPLPRDASGKTCFCDTPEYQKLRRVFSWLAAEPGLGVLTGEAGLGKTTLMRHLCDQLPAPEHRILYLCDTAVTPASVYRNLAAELGLAPKYRRDALWRQLKTAIRKLFDVDSIVPILVLDEAQHLSDDFLHDLAGFLNFAFDRHDLLTVWLVGLPSLRTRLDMATHSALRSRIVSPNRLRPRTRQELCAMIHHGLKTAGANDKIVADPALEVLYRVSRGVPRTAAHLLRASLMLAHDRDQAFVDEDTVLAACDELELTRPKQDQDHLARPSPRKSRR